LSNLIINKLALLSQGSLFLVFFFYNNQENLLIKLVQVDGKLAKEGTHDLIYKKKELA